MIIEMFLWDTCTKWFTTKYLVNFFVTSILVFPFFFSFTQSHKLVLSDFDEDFELVYAKFQDDKIDRLGVKSALNPSNTQHRWINLFGRFQVVRMVYEALVRRLIPRKTQSRRQKFYSIKQRKYMTQKHQKRM